MSYFTINTERLVCRKLTADDIPKWSLFFRNNDRLHFMGFDLSKTHAAINEEWIKSQFERYRQSGLGHLAVTHKDSGELIGLAGIIPREIEGKSEHEVAYSFIPKYWGLTRTTKMAIMLAR